MLNLLPWREINHKRINKILIISAIVLVAFSLGFFWMTRTYYVTKMTTMTCSIKSLAQKNKTLNKCQLELQQVVKKYSAKEEVSVQKRNEGQIIALLEGISKNLPDNSYLTSFMSAGSEFSMEGVLLSSSQQPLTAFAKIIQDEYHVISRPITVELAELQKINFKIKMILPREK